MLSLVLLILFYLTNTAKGDQKESLSTVKSFLASVTVVLFRDSLNNF